VMEVRLLKKTGHPTYISFVLSNPFPSPETQGASSFDVRDEWTSLLEQPKPKGRERCRSSMDDDEIKVELIC